MTHSQQIFNEINLSFLDEYKEDLKKNLKIIPIYITDSKNSANYKNPRYTLMCTTILNNYHELIPNYKCRLYESTTPFYPIFNKVIVNNKIKTNERLQDKKMESNFLSIDKWREKSYSLLVIEGYKKIIIWDVKSYQELVFNDYDTTNDISNEKNTNNINNTKNYKELVFNVTGNATGNNNTNNATGNTTGNTTGNATTGNAIIAINNNANGNANNNTTNNNSNNGNATNNATNNNANKKNINNINKRNDEYNWTKSSSFFNNRDITYFSCDIVLEENQNIIVVALDHSKTNKCIYSDLSFIEILENGEENLYFSYILGNSGNNKTNLSGKLITNVISNKNTIGKKNIRVMEKLYMNYDSKIGPYYESILHMNVFVVSV